MSLAALTDANSNILFLGLGLTFAGIALLVIAIVWMSLRHVRKQREILHLERMKALEVGQSPTFFDPDKQHSKQLHNTFYIAFWIGGAVPISAVSGATYVMTEAGSQPTGIILAVWISAAAIGVAGVICASVLMLKSRKIGIGDASSFDRNESLSPNLKSDE